MFGHQSRLGKTRDVTMATHQKLPNRPEGDAATLSLYRTMLRLRRLEEKAGLLYALGTLGTPCPLGIGQEGALAGLTEALSPDDTVVAIEATPGLAVALGDTPSAALEGLRPATPPPVSPPILVRAPHQGLRRVASLADAVANGAARGVHVLISMQPGAEAFRHACAAADPVLPAVVASREAVPAVADLPPGYAVRQVDGVDASGVADALHAARADLVAGRTRPLLLIVTPPYVGHARTAGERSIARGDIPDPLSHCRRNLLASGVTTEAALADIEASVRDEMAAAGRLLAAACGDAS
jgi:pyruvate dehydrogenase E1 component alpha subunit